jgi:eukaryotic-like serine/threonine-protein kinase
VRLWDLEEGKERAMLVGHDREVHGVAFGRDRRTVISAGLDGTARVWLTGVRPNESADLSPFRDGSITAAALDDAGWELIAADGNGRVSFRLLWSPPNRIVEAGTLPLFTLPVESSLAKSGVRIVAAVPDGRGLVAANERAILLWHSIHIWPKGSKTGIPGVVPFGQPVLLPTPHIILAMSVSPDGKRLATRDVDGLRVWNLLDPKPSTPPLLVASPDLQAVVFHPSKERLALAHGGQVQVVDFAGKTLVESERGAYISAMAFDSEGQFLAAGDIFGQIRVWRVKPDGGLERQADLTGHTGGVTSLSFAPGGRTLASGGVDRTIVLWDPLTGQERLTLTGHADRLVRVQFTNNGHSLITISRDGAIKRWRADPRSGPRFASPRGGR